MMEIENLSVEECGGGRGRGLAYLGTLEVRLGGTASDALFWLEICKSSPATAVDDLMFSSSLGPSGQECYFTCVPPRVSYLLWDMARLPHASRIVLFLHSNLAAEEMPDKKRATRQLS